ncbi:MAG: HAMP domain-containing histidine kinase, partial [Gammaproteobacteria bacterium]|nr:HAMP domain-containing histidine kinase [Gammaproteobacteria bacterium]
GEFLQSDMHIDAAVERSLIAELEQRKIAPQTQRFARPFLQVIENEKVYMFAFTPLDVPRETYAPFLGIQINAETIVDWFKEAFSRGALVPSLMNESFNNDSLGIRMTDVFGNVIYESENKYDPYLGIERKLDIDYLPILKNFSLQISIARADAPQLIIGGLPGSRLPMLVFLLVLTAALLAIALWQIRKERGVAQMRTDFVSQVSHELRTPLTQIRMFTETLLLGRVRNEDEHKQALNIVDREARRLSHLVENILQFSRSERGAGKLALEEIDLIPLVRTVCDEFSNIHAGADLNFTAPAGQVACALVDKDAVRQILLNLLDNAVKYAQGPSHIHVRIEVAPPEVFIIVDDNGPGVPEQERERIWEGFYRLPREQDTAIAGTGIGLAVVRELVQLHGGDCRVTESPEGGARFIVMFDLHTSVEST